MTSVSKRAKVGLAALLLTVGLALAFGPEAHADKASLGKHEAAAKSPFSWERIEGVRGLDPNEKNEFAALTKVLNAEQWHVRAAAIDVLAGTIDGKRLAVMERAVRKARAGDSKRMIAEGYALAFGRKGDPTYLPLLQEVVQNKRVAWEVRRSAAFALGLMPDKSSVDPLIAAWTAERARQAKSGWSIQVEIRIQEALEKITQRNIGNEPADWAAWATGNLPELDLGRRDEKEDAKAEAEGRKAKPYVTKEVGFTTRGDGRPLFVLPDYGYGKGYLETYLRPLESRARLFYIDLPSPQKLGAKPAPAGGGLMYPVDELVDAFEAIREQQMAEAKAAGQEIHDKVVVMGHGVTCWIAMKYAEKFPERVAGLILVSPWSSDQAYGAALRRLEADGEKHNDVELVRHAQSLQIVDGGPKYDLGTKSREEQIAIGLQKRWSLYFRDYRDSEMTMLFYGGIDTAKDPTRDGIIRADLGSAVVPPVDVTGGSKSRVPAVIFLGDASRYTSRADVDLIAGHYATGLVVPMGKTSRMPWIEENGRFLKALSKILPRR